MDLTPIAASLILLAHTMTATYMGVDPESVPLIKGAYIVPLEELPNICSSKYCKSPSTGFYLAHQQKVYLGREYYYDEDFIFSQLLHETTHHFQRNVPGRTLRCRNKEEVHALDFQMSYLKSKGNTWVDSTFNKIKKVFKNGSCS